MTKPNYKQLFARQKQCEKILKIACPYIRHESGIYFLTREENGIKYGYIGKGIDVCRRMVSHLMGYSQRIDISLRKRGFYSSSNELGWKLKVLYFPESKLDEKEKHFIGKAIENGFVLYNIESGGTKDKTIIGERKATKNYSDGISQGKKSTIRAIRTFFDKYLDFAIKPPTSKIKERKFNEFVEFLKKDDENA